MKVRCPICRVRCEWEGNPHRPFCGERCKVIDLGNWADESYRVAGDPVCEDEEDPIDEPTRH